MALTKKATSRGRSAVPLGQRIASCHNRAMENLTIKEGRRLALARAGLLKPEWTAFPCRAGGAGKRAFDGAMRVVRRFGYLQLDTVSIAGARSHTIVLLSRLEGFTPSLGEQLLRPGNPLFEYWGHEASWLPLELYGVFDFRRRDFRSHPWWGDVIGENPEVADRLRRRIRDEGPLRSIDMEGKGSHGWWNLKVARRVAGALWSSGELAIRERTNFQRSYDLAERVIPDEHRSRSLPLEDALEVLILKALDGHGWATTGTIAATWRLRNRRAAITAALDRLVEKGSVIPCSLGDGMDRSAAGWIKPDDRELAARLKAVRPRPDRGVLLSPFDPLLWERSRVQRLFDFDQVLEVFKPASARVYGYYCLPILAGEKLIGRFDLKADRKGGKLRVVSCRFEKTQSDRPGDAHEGQAARTALQRYSSALGLVLVGAPRL